MSYRLRYGSYDFPTSMFPASEPRSRSVTAVSAVRADGGRVAPAYEGPQVLAVSGGMIKGPLDTSDLRTRLDALKAALALAPQDLYFGVDDRYYSGVTVGELGLEWDGGSAFARILNVSVNFTAPDPFQYSTSLTTDAWTVTGSAQTHVVANSTGNAYALPEYQVTVGGGGAVTIAFVVTNTTTGEAFTLAGAVTGGQVIKVNSLTKTVLIGTTDRMDLFDGEFPRLAVGNNTLSETYSAGSITKLDTVFRARWW